VKSHRCRQIKLSPTRIASSPHAHATRSRKRSRRRVVARRRYSAETRSSSRRAEKDEAAKKGRAAKGGDNATTRATRDNVPAAFCAASGCEVMRLIVGSESRPGNISGRRTTWVHGGRRTSESRIDRVERPKAKPSSDAAIWPARKSVLGHSQTT